MNEWSSHSSELEKPDYVFSKTPKYVSKLFLHDIHQQVAHPGTNHMLYKLGKKFWVPSTNSSARKMITSCVFCRFMQARDGEQRMADLPMDHVAPDFPPFSYVGIDHFGSIEVNRGWAHDEMMGGNAYPPGKSNCSHGSDEYFKYGFLHKWSEYLVLSIFQYWASEQIVVPLLSWLSFLCSEIRSSLIQLDHLECTADKSFKCFVQSPIWSSL